MLNKSNKSCYAVMENHIETRETPDTQIPSFMWVSFKLSGMLKRLIIACLPGNTVLFGAKFSVIEKGQRTTIRCKF